MSIEKVGAILVVAGFIVWFPGELYIYPYNIVGLPVLIIGAVLYFVGRRRRC